MQRVKLLGHDWSLPVSGELVAIWRSHDKDGIKSLETCGALGRLLSVDYFGSGETIILTEQNRLVKGLKPHSMDENLLRISRSWNRVDPMREVRVKAQPGRTDPGRAQGQIHTHHLTA
eukprot:1881330-Amphidinium_carterae.1